MGLEQVELVRISVAATSLPEHAISGNMLLCTICM